LKETGIAGGGHREYEGFCHHDESGALDYIEIIFLII
jgi:hypothetical protein